MGAAEPQKPIRQADIVTGFEGKPKTVESWLAASELANLNQFPVDGLRNGPTPGNLLQSVLPPFLVRSTVNALPDVPADNPYEQAVGAVDHILGGYAFVHKIKGKAIESTIHSSVPGERRRKHNDSGIQYDFAQTSGISVVTLDDGNISHIWIIRDFNTNDQRITGYLRTNATPDGTTVLEYPLPNDKVDPPPPEEAWLSALYARKDTSDIMYREFLNIPDDPTAYS